MIAVVSRNASNPVLPSAHRTIQMTKPAVTARISPMPGQILARAGQARGKFAHDRAHGAGGVTPAFARAVMPAGRTLRLLGGGANQAGAHDHAFGARVGRLPCLRGGADTEAERDRHLGARL